MTRVAIHAENPIARAGLESIVRAEAALEVIGSSSDITALFKLLEARLPDVVLLEGSFADDEASGDQLLALTAVSSPPALVVLTESNRSDWVSLALRNGIRAILPRTATSEEIVAAIGAAAAGLVILHPDAIEDLLPQSEFPPRTQPAAPIQSLTPREIEVLGMLAEGFGNKGIAKQLNISEHTVKFHISSIFTKLNASSRTEAVTLGARLGLILL